MTIDGHAGVAGAYGACELKMAYQRNMALGLCVATLLHLAVIGAILTPWSQTNEAPASVVPSGEPVSRSSATARLSNYIPSTAVQTGAPSFDDLMRTIPKPMPDEQFSDKAVFDVSHEPEAGIGTTQIGPGGNGLPEEKTRGWTSRDTPLDDYYPPPDEFVPMDHQPKPIRLVLPEYPEMARLSRQEATVLIQALVGIDGRVRDVIVRKTSGSRLGFDSAAETAAYESLYKPAIQNGTPVPVWVIYKVVFKLR